MNKLKDNDIREVLLKYLNSRYADDGNTRIINEMGVLHGQSRVDVAVVNGILHGFEIKSESDTLLRLPGQKEDYNQVFDRMHIVTQRKHLKEIRSIVPKWWGIILVTKGANNILNLKEIRKGGTNLSTNSIAICNLLWRDEAISILKERGLHTGFLSKPKKVIYQRLSENISQDDLKVLVSEKLRMRESWLVNLQ